MALAGGEGFFTLVASHFLHRRLAFSLMSSVSGSSFS